MRQYECECLNCGCKRQYTFTAEPYPEPGEAFTCYCGTCRKNTGHIRTLNRKTMAELKRKRMEEDLRESIKEKCAEYGFRCRFLYQSVVVTTDLSDWCFDYHVSRITLYHESTVKINFTTGDYAKAHVQFKDKKLTPAEVIEYIARHDGRKAKDNCIREDDE